MREKPPPTPPWGRDLEGICIDSKQIKVVSGINFLLKKSFIEINVLSLQTNKALKDGDVI